jgi:hypothetical protein
MDNIHKPRTVTALRKATEDVCDRHINFFEFARKYILTCFKPFMVIALDKVWRQEVKILNIESSSQGLPRSTIRSTIANGCL